MRYTYATCLGWGGDIPDAEIDVRLSYAVAWGSPAAVQDLCVEKIEGRPSAEWPAGLLVQIRDKLEDLEADLFPLLIDRAHEVDADRHWEATKDAF